MVATSFKGHDSPYNAWCHPDNYKPKEGKTDDCFTVNDEEGKKSNQNVLSESKAIDSDGYGRNDVADGDDANKIEEGYINREHMSYKVQSSKAYDPAKQGEDEGEKKVP